MGPSIPIGDIPYVGPSYTKKLEKLGISTVNDLFHHVPSRYIDFSQFIPISNAQIGELVTIQGEVTFLKNQYTKSGRKVQIGEIKDNSGKITIVWFNQPFLVKTIYPQDTLSIAGKVDWFGRSKALISPIFEKTGEKTHTGRLIPIYPETAGISSRWIRSRIKYIFQKYFDQEYDYLPNEIKTKHNLLSLSSALVNIHYPEDTKSIEGAKKRLAFDELLSLHLASHIRKLDWQARELAQKITLDRNKIEEFISRLPYKLTRAQKKSLDDIFEDLVKDQPMNRLLEGDVGSGKTVIAAITAYACYLSGFKSIFMAPTQILAHQHFLTLKKMFKDYNLKVSLTTASIKRKNALEADILIGTHALINKKGSLKNIGLVIIDEQHKFGVGQRYEIVSGLKPKLFQPHCLTMTATPIPRTVALTLYGDMDLSVIDELPKGRIIPKTWIVGPEKRDAAYEWIRNKIIKDKTQVFIICPLVEESGEDTLINVRAVKSEYENIKKIFSEYKVGLLYGKLKDKDKVVDSFRKGSINILVSTPVVEVGIDVANANIMIIETADRFGLAQLHQLRGRIGRGEDKSYCLLFTQNSSPKSIRRLRALKEESSGFKLSEIDLTLRGPGEVFGLKQHGLPELKIASWMDYDLIKSTKEAAKEIVKNKKLYKSIANNIFESKFTKV